DDLNPDAIAKAREKYTAKHQRERWAGEITGWNDAKFLDKAAMASHGQLTRTALLLLGRAESARWLSPNPAEILWKVPTERIADPFGPPFLLTTTEVGLRIRNPNIKLFPATELLAVELARYDTQVILEGLHNCLAHQDYEQGGRVVVEELSGRLRLTNPGSFVDGKPEDYFDGSRTPEKYRNPRLVQAMRLIGMIDKGGFGIRDMVAAQRRRYLPLPDYEGSAPNQTVFNIYGQAIDENYSKLLMERADLPLEHVLWLDRVQKKLKVDSAQIAELRKAGLIEGRKPHWHVSASIAAATGAQSEYILNRGFSEDYYKRLMLERLDKFGPASGRQLRELIWDKLPNALSKEARETKVKNLRTALRLRGLDGKQIEIDPSGPARGPNAIWRLRI
ncbi:MAG: transcriptional regulator, partial [Alcaligenaceae bacterium]